MGAALFMGQIHCQLHRGDRVLDPIFWVFQLDGPPQVLDPHMFQRDMAKIFLCLYVFQHSSPL